jgi:hypothetical protein
MRPELKRLRGKAEAMGFFYDPVRDVWAKYREGATHARAVWIAPDGKVHWAIYGPDDMFGFWSRLREGTAKTMREGEVLSRKNLETFES